MCCAPALAKGVPMTDPLAHPQTRSSMQVCTSTSWAPTRPSSARLESRRPCARISTTPGGSMVSRAHNTSSGQHVWGAAQRS